MASTHTHARARALSSTLLMPEVHAWAMERPALVAAGLTRGLTVVDLGCGDGTMTRFLSGEVGPEGLVIAVDVDEQTIRAQEEAEAGRLRNPIDWRAASAYDTGLDDASVDLVIARQLFQHLTDPRRALDEVRRILKPGGRVVLLDAHDGLLWLQPEPEGHEAFMERAAEQQRLRGGDREIGRKLGGLLAEAGFDDIDSDVHTFDTEKLPVPLFVRLALEPVSASLVGDHAAAAAEHVERCGRALEADGAHGSAGFYATWATRA